MAQHSERGPNSRASHIAGACVYVCVCGPTTPRVLRPMSHSAQVVERIDSSIADLERQLSGLQNQKAESMHSAAEVSDSMEVTRARLAEASSLHTRHLENAELARAALMIAHVQSVDAHELLNPLNHPMIKQYFDKK